MSPHAEALVEWAGRPLGDGTAAMVLVHGRGASAHSILELSGPLAHPDFTYAAPGAVGHSWYPYSFMSPIESNEPHLGSALEVIGRLVATIEEAGTPKERIIIGGFSQGACLSSEFAVRNPARYGGLLVFSGGLIGPRGTTWPEHGALDGTPVFVGCSDVDAHIPVDRVEETARILGERGAAVDLRIYPGMGHLVNGDELTAARSIVEAVGGQGTVD